MHVPCGLQTFAGGRQGAVGRGAEVGVVGGSHTLAALLLAEALEGGACQHLAGALVALQDTTQQQCGVSLSLMFEHSIFIMARRTWGQQTDAKVLPRPTTSLAAAAAMVEVVGPLHR